MIEKKTAPKGAAMNRDLIKRIMDENIDTKGDHEAFFVKAGSETSPLVSESRALGDFQAYEMQDKSRNGSIPPYVRTYAARLLEQKVIEYRAKDNRPARTHDQSVAQAA